MSNVEGYYHLAMAVIQQAVTDLDCGRPARRADAQAAIEVGGLDRWVDMICVTHHERDAVHAKLRELAARASVGA